MESFPVDIDPGHLVRWIRAERNISPSAFVIGARRRREVRPLPESVKYRFGDEEREDLSEIATIATLDIAPAHANDGWCLCVEVESETGSHINAAGKEGEEEEISLERFYSELERSGAGTANVFAEVEDEAARRRLNALLSLVESNTHGRANRPPPG